MSKKYKCVILAARKHGLAALAKLIELNSSYEVIVIFTHRLNPLSYDPARKIRSDFEDFVNLANSNNIPLYTIDYKNEQSKLKDFCMSNDFDFLISISWRYLISPSVFKKACIGSINIHRGDLPKYAGIEPIRRALENNEEKIVISSHHISENFDQGEIICKTNHPTNYDHTKSLESNVERLKEEITQYFPQLTIKSLELLLKH